MINSRKVISQNSPTKKMYILRLISLIGSHSSLVVVLEKDCLGTFVYAVPKLPFIIIK